MVVILELILVSVTIEDILGLNNLQEIPEAIKDLANSLPSLFYERRVLK